MHDLDRRDLVFETDSLDEGAYMDPSGEFDGDELSSGDDSEGVFDEVEQSELASELLGVSEDHELDQFLGSLIRKAKSKLGPISNIVAGNVGGLLKGAVKKALPKVAGIAGGMFGGPLGAAIASQGVPALSSIFGLELEGLSSEDQEFEAAKQLVRMAGAAIENAANSGPGGSPAQTAKQAVLAAARRHAPGLVSRGGMNAGGQRGHWYRRGNTIVLVGV